MGVVPPPVASPHAGPRARCAAVCDGCAALFVAHVNPVPAGQVGISYCRLWLDGLALPVICSRRARPEAYRRSLACPDTQNGQQPSTARARRTLSVRHCSPSSPATSPLRRAWATILTRTTTPPLPRRWPRPRRSPCPRTRSRAPSTRPSAPVPMRPCTRTSSTRAMAPRALPSTLSASPITATAPLPTFAPPSLTPAAAWAPPVPLPSSSSARARLSLPRRSWIPTTRRRTLWPTALPAMRTSS